MIRPFFLVLTLALLLVMAPAPCPADPSPDSTSSQNDESKPVSLFDGKSLDGWQVIMVHDFQKHGKVAVENGEIVLEAGRPATGISYQRAFPQVGYEVTLDAKRVAGGDFFCGMTFPIAKEHCTLIIGGWGGGVTGLSNIDDESAVENETTSYVDFRQDQWYRIRLRVTSKRIQAWVDDEEIVNVKTAQRKFSIWWEQEPVRPFGVATWNTAASLRNIQLTRLTERVSPPANE